MRFGKFALVLSAMFATGALFAQNPPTIKQVPLKQTSPVSGQQMFATYCAVCHGPTGKGNGPAAAALKKAPGDLTKLAAGNKGKFPEEKVTMAITGSSGISAHGSVDMPIWGDLFKSVSSDNAIVRLRVSNLTDHLKSIQSK